MYEIYSHADITVKLCNLALHHFHPRAHRASLPKIHERKETFLVFLHIVQDKKDVDIINSHKTVKLFESDHTLSSNADNIKRLLPCVKFKNKNSYL